MLRNRERNEQRTAIQAEQKTRWCPIYGDTSGHIKKILGSEKLRVLNAKRPGNRCGLGVANSICSADKGHT